MYPQQISHQIKKLTRYEKLQLINDITKMLKEEEEHIEKFVNSSCTYPVYTPDGQEKAAFELQRFLDEKKS